MKTKKNERSMSTRGYRNIVFTQDALKKEDVGSQDNDANHKQNMELHKQASPLNFKP
jgi:hypothetical protein